MCRLQSEYLFYFFFFRIYILILLFLNPWKPSARRHATINKLLRFKRIASSKNAPAPFGPGVSAACQTSKSGQRSEQPGLCDIDVNDSTAVPKTNRAAWDVNGGGV